MGTDTLTENEQRLLDAVARLLVAGRSTGARSREVTINFGLRDAADSEYVEVTTDGYTVYNFDGSAATDEDDALTVVLTDALHNAVHD